MKTKLVFTLGPATDRPGVLASLLRTGMSCARMNFSHGSHDEHARRFRAVHLEAGRQGRLAAVLMDLCGPKLRVGRLPHGEMKLALGQHVRLIPGHESCRQEEIPVPYSGLARDVKIGDVILMDDGLLRLQAEKVLPAMVVAKVLQGGVLRDRKGINLPGAMVHLPALTSKDKQDLEFGLRLGVDFVALSFVRHAKDISQLRQHMRGARTAIIAKIEKPQAIPHLEEIIQAADGVMIARGDLGVEMNPEQVPVLQKRIISLAQAQGRFVITATQMLQSMMENPSPTRAEASDVANAIFDGTDAIMLSGETASGKYPKQAATMMATIANAAEQSPEYNRLHSPAPLSLADQVVETGVALAERIKAKALVVFTHTGNTARLISRRRPSVPVVVLAHSAQIQRQLQLHWGLCSMRIQAHSDGNIMIRRAEQCLRMKKMAKPGDTLVILASTPSNHPTNYMKVHTLRT